MKNLRTAVLAGIAALALAGSAFAAAQGPARHKMTVRTPDGGVATIEYTGNVRPTVRFGTMPAPAAFLGAAPPFATIDRISAAMNREMDVLLRQANMLAMPFAPANPLYNATLKDVPGFCMQSVEITQNGSAKPQVTEHSAGNCGHAASLNGATSHAIPRNGHGMLKADSKAPAHHRLPMFYEAGYTPH